MGFSCFRHPEYLYQTTTGLFVFRLRVPQDCKAIIGKAELKYSLKTRCIRTARKHLASILVFLDGLLNEIRSGLMSDITIQSIGQTIRKSIQNVRDSPERIMVNIPPANLHHPSKPSEAAPIKANETTFSDISMSFIKEKELSK